MTLTTWMTNNYDLALGQRTADIMRELREDGVKARHESVVIDAFTREMLRRRALSAKFRKRRAA